MTAENAIHDKAYRKMREVNREKKSGGKKLESIRITVAENGFSVRCDYRSEPGKKGEVSPCYEPGREKVFESSDSLLKFLNETL